MTLNQASSPGRGRIAATVHTRCIVASDGVCTIRYTGNAHNVFGPSAQSGERKGLGSHP